MRYAFISNEFILERNLHLYLFFFFQAEDGIRDLIVTGVQTCALPICPASTSLRTAMQTGSFLYESTAGAPRLRFATRMLYFVAFVGFEELSGLVGSTGLRIQLSALRRSEVLPTPFESSTRRLMMSALRAMPS